MNSLAVLQSAKRRTDSGGAAVAVLAAGAALARAPVTQAAIDLADDLFAFAPLNATCDSAALLADARPGFLEFRPMDYFRERTAALVQPCALGALPALDSVPVGGSGRLAFYSYAAPPEPAFLVEMNTQARLADADYTAELNWFIRIVVASGVGSCAGFFTLLCLVFIKLRGCPFRSSLVPFI